MPSQTTNHRIDLDRKLSSGNEGVLSHAVSLSSASWQNSVDRGEGIQNWRKVIAAGQNATTTLSGTKSELQSSRGLCAWTRTSRLFPDPVGRLEYIAEGHLLDCGIPTHSFELTETKADNLALTRYYSNLNAVTTSFKGLVFTGELRESLRLIRSPGKALRNGVSHYLQTLRQAGPMISRRRRPSFVRDTWLEYSFGWKPIINDIDSAIRAFYLSKAARPIFEMVKGTGKEITIRDFSNNSGSHGPLTWFYDTTVSEECYVKYFGIQFSEGRGVSDSHSYGFRPSEFIPTIWELLPYSFLVDYFSNIGDIIQSWSYRFIRNGWTAKTVRRTLKRETSNETAQLFDVNDFAFNYRGTGHPGHQSAQKVTVVRIPDVHPGVPFLELQVPGMDSRWVNILALSKQLDLTRRALGS